MFKFEKEQSVWDFNGAKIGGQPAECPTVLGASIFYNKHEVVLDDHKGTIDKAKAEAFMAGQMGHFIGPILTGLILARMGVPGLMILPVLSILWGSRLQGNYVQISRIPCLSR